jgi:CRP-like cAMP-binding protein
MQTACPRGTRAALPGPGRKYAKLDLRRRACRDLPGIGSITAQVYPTRPITLIVPYAAGGATDCHNVFPLANGANEALLERMSALSNWPRNRLLLALPARNLKQLMPELEHIPCQVGQVLIDADSSLDYVFLPDNGVVSVVAVYADGSIIEMATIGREGCTGVQALFGAKNSSIRVLVQTPGSAAKISRAAFTRAMETMPSFRNLMYAYVQAFLEQVLVSVACNGAPFAKMISPVSHPASSEARNAATRAMSSGWPTRPSDVLAIICFLNSVPRRSVSDLPRRSTDRDAPPLSGIHFHDSCRQLACQS